jgi:hypothetical protein
LSKLKPVQIKEQLKAPLVQDPLLDEPDPDDPESIKLSTTGFWCLAAYWVFASEVFDADLITPGMEIFPDHFEILSSFLSEEPQSRIQSNPGTTEALLVMGLWLDSHKNVAAKGSEPESFMQYHHLLTLSAVFHPSLSVRNVGTALSGLILHADPDDTDRLRILEDLIESCVFPSLQACAVSWLREELILAQKTKQNNQFSTPEAIEQLQYVLFPDLNDMKSADPLALWDLWAQDHPFHLQVANFAYFLSVGNDFKHLVPAGMGAAVEQRYIEPLLGIAKTLVDAIEKGDFEGEGNEGEARMQLNILTDRLKSVSLQ